MHEASIAKNMLEIAARAAGESSGQVKRVVVSLGELSGIMPDALEFAFDAMKKDMGFEKASLSLQTLPLRAKCRECGLEYAPEGFPAICPECKSRSFCIIQGEEIYVKELLL